MRTIFFLGFLLLKAVVFAQTPPAETEITAASGRQTAPDDTNHVYGMHELTVLPVFPGGEAQLLKFVLENFRIPRECGSNAGKIVVQFVVDTTGDCRDVKILRPASGECFEPVIAGIFTGMPCWKPGQRFGRPVVVKFILPVFICRE